MRFQGAYMASQFTQFASQKPSQEIPDVVDIDPQELWQKKDQVMVIDVRRPDEFTGELGHVPGAKLMVLDSLPQSIGEVPKDKTVVFVCRSGGRSGRAAQFARAQGLVSVFNMSGGMLKWNDLGLEVEGRNG
jgi:rhodanese-related sulfurtransferase